MSISCVSPLTEYSNSDCFEQFAGGIDAMVVYVSAVPTDPSDATELQGMLDDGEAVLLTKLKIGINEPSPINTDSLRSCSSEITTSYDRVVTLQDAGVIEQNIAFYNSANASTGFAAMGLLLPNCDDPTRSFYVEDTIRFEGGLIVPDNDNAEPQHFAFNLKYRSKADPLLVTTPTGIFT